MKSQFLFPALALVLAMLACNFPSNVPVTETPTLDVLPLPSATQLLSTNTPTQTPLPNDTPLPPSTATPSVPVAFPKDVAVNCRFGPGTAWVAISALTVGQTSQITGKTSDGSWWNITDPLNSGRRCWVSASVVNTAGNLAGIPVAATPSASVTNVEVSVDPKTITLAACSDPFLPLEFSGTIETNGPTTVEWHFETQLGGTMLPKTTDFNTFGEKEVSTTYSPSSPLTAGTYWVRLIVTDPNDMQAETTYKIECP